MADLTTIILTYNEEKNIRKCIESVKLIAKRIIVIDSFSKDDTVRIASELGAEVYTRKFINQADQFSYALSECKIDTLWVMKLDADERLTNESNKELSQLCSEHTATDVNGFILRFEVNFLGKKLRYGGIYPFCKLAVFKYGKGYVEKRNMDEHIVLYEGKSIELKNDSLHEDYKDLNTWIEKHNKYSNREVKDFLEKEESNEASNLLNPKAKIKRILKYKVYYKLPMGLRAYLYYIYRYYIKLGFLDGKEGKIFAFLQAYWYRFLVDAKIYENEKD